MRRTSGSATTGAVIRRSCPGARLRPDPHRDFGQPVEFYGIDGGSDVALEFVHGFSNFDCQELAIRRQ